MADDRNVHTELLRHPRRWLMVRFQLPLPINGAFIGLPLMLNTGRPESALAQDVYRTLDALGVVTPVRGSTFAIRNARLEGMAMPDIPMRLSAGPALLGLDFLSQFAEMRVNFETLRLTLVRS